MFNLKKQAKLKDSYRRYLSNLYKSNPKKFIEKLKILLDDNAEIARSSGDYDARYGPNVNVMKNSIESMMGELKAAMYQKQFDLVNEIYIRYAKQLYDQLQAVDRVMEAQVDSPFIETHAAGSGDCGGFDEPKAGDHLDTQMYPECKGKRGDRDIVGNYRKKQKKKKAEIAVMLQRISEKGPKNKARGTCVFKSTNTEVSDNKDHFPINDLSHGSNALSRVEQYDSVPSWYDGTLDSLKGSVKSAVYKKFPGLKSRKEKREGE